MNAKLLLTVSLSLSAAGCGAATTRSDTPPYITAVAPAEPASDTVPGLDAEPQGDYPMLYHQSPGMRRLNWGRDRLY